jgi:hypothetical protein
MLRRFIYYRFAGSESRLASAVSLRSGLTDETGNDAPAYGRFSTGKPVEKREARRLF